MIYLRDGSFWKRLLNCRQKNKIRIQKNARNMDKSLLFSALVDLLLPKKMAPKESIMQKKRYEDKLTK